MFKPQFAPLVESGVKRQTVRPIPVRMPKPGDKISLREWTGKPYRSKQRVLRESIISEVAMVDITETGIAVNSYPEPCDDFASADGFRDFFELRDWFKATHGLPFGGVVIKWHNERSEREAAAADEPKRERSAMTAHNENNRKRKKMASLDKQIPSVVRALGRMGLSRLHSVNDRADRRNRMGMGVDETT